MISQATLDQLETLGHDIQRDTALIRQRGIDTCWHWWRVGKALTADPELYAPGTTTIPLQTSVRICEVLGLSTKPGGGKRIRPNGEAAVRRAIEVFNAYSDEDAAKIAIEEAGALNKLTRGMTYGSRPSGAALSIPTALMGYLSVKAGIEGKEAAKWVAAYLRDPDVQGDIVDFIKEERRKPKKQKR
jgi:hypothetical protein